MNLFTASSKVPLLIRQNTSVSGARPNPQGSFRYGSINITDTYMLKVLPPTLINGHVRAAINGISFVKPDIPFRLADQRKLRGVYKLDFPSFHMDGYSFFVVGMGYGEWSENSRGTYNKWDEISHCITIQVFPEAQQYLFLLITLELGT
ncbi:hypothetical protein K1719_036446 [Acacia pycnantha]|nr:hypothetical protein K1719_036446 [Acacia pycnantha]